MDKSHSEKPKFCKIHKTTSHDDNECRSQKKNNNASDKSYALVEGYIQPQNIELNVTINGQQTKALVDTGSVYNYVTQHMVDKANLKTRDLGKFAIAEMANGDTIRIEKESQVQFNLINNLNVIYNELFRIIPESSASMILGMNFLQKNDAIINMKEGLITIDGLGVEILNNRLINDLIQT